MKVKSLEKEPWAQRLLKVKPRLVDLLREEGARATVREFCGALKSLQDAMLQLSVVGMVAGGQFPEWALEAEAKRLAAEAARRAQAQKRQQIKKGLRA